MVSNHYHTSKHKADVILGQRVDHARSHGFRDWELNCCAGHLAQGVKVSDYCESKIRSNNAQTTGVESEHNEKKHLTWWILQSESYDAKSYKTVVEIRILLNWGGEPTRTMKHKKHPRITTIGNTLRTQQSSNFDTLWETSESLIVWQMWKRPFCCPYERLSLLLTAKRVAKHGISLCDSIATHREREREPGYPDLTIRYVVRCIFHI